MGLCPARFCRCLNGVRAVWVGLATVISFSNVRAADCIRYGEYAHWVGGVTLAGTQHDIAVSGSLAFTASWSAGLQVVNISDPATPTLMGSVVVTLKDEAWGVAVDGQYAYLTDRLFGLRVIDASNPFAPTIVGELETRFAWNVAVAGRYAYVADSDSLLRCRSRGDPEFCCAGH